MKQSNNSVVITLTQSRGTAWLWYLAAGLIALLLLGGCADTPIKEEPALQLVETDMPSNIGNYDSSRESVSKGHFGFYTTVEMENGSVGFAEIDFAWEQLEPERKNIDGKPWELQDIPEGSKFDPADGIFDIASAPRKQVWLYYKDAKFWLIDHEGNLDDTPWAVHRTVNIGIVESVGGIVNPDGELIFKSYNITGVDGVSLLCEQALADKAKIGESVSYVITKDGMTLSNGQKEDCFSQLYRVY